MFSEKFVYLFREGNGSMKNLLRGKGSNLAEMTSLETPVSQGFTITTAACNRYYKYSPKKHSKTYCSSSSD